MRGAIWVHHLWQAEGLYCSCNTAYGICTKRNITLCKWLASRYLVFRCSFPPLNCNTLFIFTFLVEDGLRYSYETYCKQLTAKGQKVPTTKFSDTFMLFPCLYSVLPRHFMFVYSTQSFAQMTFQKGSTYGFEEI